MKPAVKREAVQHLQSEHGYSQRRACRLTQCHRETARHTSGRTDDAELRERLKALAQEHKRWGYRLLTGTLRLEGFTVNHKRVYRLYTEEKLVLRPKHRKRLKSEKRGPLQAPTRPNQSWTMDFVSDALSDGRPFRTLNIIDTYTRQCLHIEADTSLGGQRVVRALEALVQQHGTPALIQIDNGPEFRGHALDVWATQNGVELVFIEPGKPTQNAYIESFNSRFRAECLDQEWFSSLKEARRVIEEWRVLYNTLRPHSSLDYLPPDVWAQQHHSLSL